MITIKHRHHLLDLLWQIQQFQNYISDENIKEIAEQLGVSAIEIEGVISFYHFLWCKPTGKFTIYLNNSILSKQQGFAKIKQAFETGTGTSFGKIDSTGTFGLYQTSCIGLSDMEPAALINFRPFVNLTSQKVHQIILDLKSGKNIDEICDYPETKIQYTPKAEKTIFFRNYEKGTALKVLKNHTPESVISSIKEAHLTGMGGAFFPTHIKWAACRAQENSPKYIVCNADEGEPGTFKDRVIMQKFPGLLLEGMIIAGFAVGASEGIIYLRAEYFFLKKSIEKEIKIFRRKKYLGENILGHKGFNFDIRLQMGAGAYVCGEETALLQSMEGKRGEPRAKVYFPVERGFLNKPTVVNNVETLCSAARILELGTEFYKNIGTIKSRGTKLISVAGDCKKPGIYEIEWGMTVKELLDLCGAKNTFAVQASGPSGELLPPQEFDRRISLEDLFDRKGIRCGGSFMVFNKDRNLLNIVQNFNKFFVNESCGICTPCRAGNFILSRELRKIRRGLVDQNDLQNINKWAKIMRYSSRCGLGQTAPNPVIQAIERFPKFFEEIVKADHGMNKQFNLNDAVKEYDTAVSKHIEI